jgi:hypothetical protein
MTTKKQRAIWNKAQRKRRTEHPEEIKELSHRQYRQNPEKSKTATKNWRIQNPGYDQKWRNENREKLNEYQRQWRLDNQEKVRLSNKNSHLKRTFGITLEEYNEIFKQQNHKCAACGNDNPGRKTGWALDHDHITGKIRAILCNQCNTTLGNVKDDPKILQMLINYLGRFQLQSS